MVQILEKRGWHQNNGEPGFVYIIKNSAFKKNWIKIGCSRRGGEVRAKELDTDATTGMPAEFKCVWELYTEDCGRAEKDVHSELRDCRRGKRGQEWFEVSEKIARVTITKHCKKYVDAAKAGKLEKKTRRLKKKAKELRKEAGSYETKATKRRKEAESHETEVKNLEKELGRLKRGQKTKVNSIVLWCVSISVISFVLWSWWKPIVFFSSLAVTSFVLYFSGKYLKNKIFSDDVDDADREAPEDDSTASIPEAMTEQKPTYS